MSTTPTPSRIPAHELWVEITTRITSQDLHFRSGKEEAAVSSVVSIFETTRELMRQNPNAREFLGLAGAMLETIRPYTARWHAALGADERFAGPVSRRQFRAELRQLQPQIVDFAGRLKDLRDNGRSTAVPARTPARPSLGGSVPLGIDTTTNVAATAPDPAAAGESLPLAAAAGFQLMNECERAHVAARRGVEGNAQLLDGTGLALSGGGIRSATFCLGVVQVLAEAKLLTQFDYLSTVSGGGYLGSFLSNQFNVDDVAHERSETAPDVAARARGSFQEALPGGAHDSVPVRHLRNSSKYLLPTSTLERLKLAGLLFSGVLSTTLLAAALPVACALLVYGLTQAGLFKPVTLFGFTLAPLWTVAAGAAVIVALCWLLRPIQSMWRHARDLLDNVAAYTSIVGACALVVAATPWAIAALNDAQIFIKASIASAIATLGLGAAVVKAISAAWKYRKIISRLFIFSGALLFVLAYLAVAEALGIGNSRDSSAAAIIVAVALLAWLLWSALINLNLTGLHRYYRDRLASCYLAPPARERGIAHPPPLERLSSKLPYHLVNTTVNVTNSDNPDLRGRGGDFFLLSKHVCGSTITGFRRTSELSKMNPDLDLATAMAISGAAASTNMGWQTMREYRTLMAIFNVRLGYWLRWRKGPTARVASNAFVQLTREMFGLLSDSSSAINLSDGGHIDNLAAYELIRRKVKFIVCIDGGQDGAMDCADLSRLQRLVAIDFGYELDFDVADLKLIDRYSSSYGMLAKIDYTPEVGETRDKQLGWMLYIKLAMLGTESNYVLDYQRQNPPFPHQTTIDQFFDEAQFEAYRKLGETAARSFLSEAFNTRQVASFEAWFTQLAGFLLPDTDPVYRP